MDSFEEDEDRHIYHGTKREVANFIFRKKELDEHATWWFTEDLALAKWFANRACLKGKPDLPAVLSITLSDSDLVYWKRINLITPLPFDEGDAAYLRGKIQIKFSSQAIEFINLRSYKPDWKVLL